MRLTVVGSGDAFNALGRLHSCYLLEGEGHRPTMIDFGATALAGLHRLGRSATEIGTFVFTHLHGDHIGGTPFLFIDAIYADRRSSPLRLVGPTGLEARLRALLEVTYGADLLDRPEAPTVSFEELPPGAGLDLGGLRVETFAADHQDPPEQPLCLRLTDGAGARVAFSGDTRVCEGLLAAGEDVDLLVAECSGLTPPMGRHITWAEWLVTFPRLTARRILLTHLGADVRGAIPGLLTQALEHLPSSILLEFADDGEILDITAAAAAKG